MQRAQFEVVISHATTHPAWQQRLLRASWVVLHVFVCVMALFAAKNVGAQTVNGGWSAPARLFQDTGDSRELALAADQAGNLHVVWAYGDERGASRVLMYARWDGIQWTPPIDIIAAEGAIQGPSLVVDRHGRIHLIWHGSGNMLYYSYADAQRAERATAWSRPSGLAPANSHAAITADAEGVLYVVYPALLDGGVEVITSADRGATWTLPAPVARLVHAMATADFVRIAAAPEGDLHVVWTELMLPDGYPSFGVFYSRSADQGKIWSDPLEMAGEGYVEINVLAVHRDEIHVAWNGLVGISGRYHRWSSDGGLTWSAPDPIVLPEMKGGSTGPPGLTADNAGNLYAVVNTGDTIAREGPGEFGAAIFLAWTGGGWTPPLNLSSVDPTYSSMFNEESGIAAVRGNELNVLFFGDAQTTLWHTTVRTLAPSVASQPFEKLTETMTSPAHPSSAPPAPDAQPYQVDASTSTLRDHAVMPDRELTRWGASPVGKPGVSSLFISTLLAAVLVLATFFVQISRQRK